MSLFIEWEVEIGEEIKKSVEEVFQRAIAAALTSEGVATPTEIGLTVVSAETIKAMNAEYRGIDKVTDVLSFPLLDYDEEEPEERIQKAFEMDEIDPETEEVMLGDIIICLERAKEQAEEYGHSLLRELGFLAVHSVLHLLGYDHMTEEEETIMFGKQRSILNGIGLSR